MLNANARVAIRFLRQLVSICLACLLIFSLHWLLFQREEHVPGAYTRPLGACILDWYSRRGVLVLGCPRTDAIRVWPLPIQYNWIEDPTPPPFDQVDKVTC